MKFGIGFILLAYSCLIHAGPPTEVLSSTAAAAQSGFSLLPERYITIFRHGLRADHHSATNHPREQTNPSGVLNDWQQDWDFHDPGLAPNEHQTALQESIQNLLSYRIGPTVIISSPYLRSIQTARIIQWQYYQARHEFVGIAIDRRLGEWPYAAFGRFQNPISPIQARGVRDITPATWDPAILETEMTRESGRAHARRVRGVLTELADRHVRPLIVGHMHTVTAARPINDNSPGIEQGHFFRTTLQQLNSTIRQVVLQSQH